MSSNREAFLDAKLLKDPRVQRLRERLKEITNACKDRPCMDCGESYSPWVMQFDHRDPVQKQFAISEALSLMPSEDCLLNEIDKCDVVCANCHAERTHTRREKKREVQLLHHRRWLEGRAHKPGT